MTPQEKQSIKDEIEKQLAQTSKNIESLREQIKPIPLDGTIGRVTRMDAIQCRSIAEANLREGEGTLSLLEHALADLDADNFGECSICKKQIPLERILAIPGVRLCVGCAAAR